MKITFIRIKKVKKNFFFLVYHTIFFAYIIISSNDQLCLMVNSHSNRERTLLNKRMPSGGLRILLHS